MPKVENPTSDKEATNSVDVIPLSSPEKLGVLKAIRDHADLRIPPRPLEVNKGHKHITLGDLHGNAIKLIYTLIEEGVLEVEEKNYRILNYLYNSSPEDLTIEDIVRFKSILDSTTVNKDKSITLIGDELADRGNNDWFTLLVIKKLHEAEVDLDIIISNHGVDFFEELEGIKPSIQSSFTCSYQNMALLITYGLISEDEVEDLVNDHYIPVIKALGYSISDTGELTIYSHAPIGLETIEAIALELGVTYDDKNQASLMRTIDLINREIHELFTTKKLAEFLKDEELKVINDKTVKENDPIPLKYPLFRLIWNRGLGTELRMKSKNGLFEISDVHGHVGLLPIKTIDGLPSSKHYNVDNNFGKSLDTIQARIGSSVEHFTRRSTDSPINTLKYLLIETLAEIKSLKTDKNIDEFLAEQKMLISNTEDKAELLKIKEKLEIMLNPPRKSEKKQSSSIFFSDKILLQITELKDNAYDMLFEIRMLEDIELDKFIEEQCSAIEAVILKAKSTHDASSLNEVIIDLTHINEIITEKQELIDSTKPYAG